MKQYSDWIKRITKRGFAAFLAASLIVTCYPESGMMTAETGDISVVYATSTDSTEEGTTSSLGTGWTDEEIGTGTYEVTDAEAEESDKYSITENISTETFKAFNNMETWMNRSYVSAPANTYSLTVATGATDGSDVLYFSINYKDTNNISRKQFLFPHVDAFKKSDDLLNYYFHPVDSSSTGSTIYDTYGSSVAEQLNYKDEHTEQAALGAFTVQDFAFQTEAEIKTIESIDVYIEVGSWTIQGMSVYKVNNYKGMEEYGLISGQTFFDFEGECIADVKKKDESTSLTLPYTGSGTDTVTRITKDKSKKAYIENHRDNSGAIPDDYKKGFASNSSVRTFRMDFADYYEGGLESFINADAKTMKDFEVVEDIAVEIQYKDTHGWTRKVVLPVILSSYGEAMQSLGDEVIMGFGQRGDTIAFQGLFPDYSTIMGKPVVYVGPWAREEIAKYGITAESNEGSVLTKTASDDIRIAGMSFYEGGCMPILVDGTDSDGNEVQGATIQYLFENKYPTLYQTTDEVKGRQVKADGSDSFKFSTYKSTAPLIAADKGTDQFLVTVKTSDKSMTDASSDLSLKLVYKTLEGQTAYTSAYKAKEASNNYMGYWPDVNGKNFLDNSALVAGGQVSFIVEAKDFSEFTGAELTVLGDNNWVMKNIEISYLQTYTNRLAYYHKNESAGAESNFWLERSATTAEVFNLMGSNYTVKDSNGKDLNGSDDDSEVGATGKVQKLDEDGDPMYDDDGNPIYEDYSDVPTTKTTGDQVFNHGETYTVSFDSDNQIDVRTQDYADVRYSMTFAQTQMDWGFFKVKKSYDIAVEVAPDNDYDDGNGNSGSKNHFYFQLIFKNGNSAYVLANQQLSADGFRSGREETFSISINQDYGELSGIRIIPEDTSSDSEPFDKLNINRVTVSEQTSGGSYISYVIDQVGWIDIDYRDELESASTRGQKARTAEELSKVYKVSYRERNVKLLCEVTYEPWSGKYGQFIGSVKAVIEYECASDGKIKTKTIDVVKGMADYLNTTVSSVETTYDSEGHALVPEDGLGTYSDPKTMMRPNHTDRFVIPAISDLKSIKSITFTAKNVSETNTQWNIGKVCISQVIKDGSLRLSDNDEYVRDMTTRYLCMSDNKETLENQLEINNITELPTINFTYNEIVWSSEEWATPVTRVPTSENDTVNIYVFPTENQKIAAGTKVDAKLNYNLPFSQYQSVSASELTHDKNALGQEVYYTENKNAAGFISAGKLKVHSISEMTMNHAVVQHLREGTVIDTYTYSYLDSTAKNYPTVEPRVNTNWIDSCREVLALSFGPGTPTQELVAEDHDIAIGFTYTSTIDGGTTEFQSPYVYFTDVGINEVSEGLFAEIPFDVAFVKEITGYTIAAYGNVQGNINNSCGQVYGKNTKTGALTKRSYVSFKETYALSEHLLPHKPTSKENFGEDSVTPISITFTTTDITKGNDSTQHPSVKMLLKYKKCDGTKPILAFQDITPYIQDSGTTKKTTDADSIGQFTFIAEGEEEVIEEVVDTGGFQAGETQTVKFFIEDMGKDLTLVSAALTPYNAEVVVESPNAVIDEVSDESETTVQTILDEAGNGEDVDLNNSSAADLTQQILENRNATWTISSVSYNAGFGTNAPAARENLNMTFSGYNTREKNTLRLVNITMLCDIAKNTESKQTATTGNTMQISAKADDKLYGNVYVVDPAQGGFKVKAYRVIGNATEEVADTLSDITTDGFLFTVPKNETDANVVYRIEVYPTNGPDLISAIEVTVEPTKEETEEEKKEETDTGDVTKQKGEGNTEATTEKTTEATTEKTTEAPAQDTNNNTDTTNNSGQTDTNSGNTSSGESSGSGESSSSGEGSGSGSEGGSSGEGSGSGSEGGSSGEGSGSGSEGGSSGEGSGSGSEGGSSGSGSGSEGGSSGEGSGSETP